MHNRVFTRASRAALWRVAVEALVGTIDAIILFIEKRHYCLLLESKSIADGLNPLTISHNAKTISCKAIGEFKTM